MKKPAEDRKSRRRAKTIDAVNNTTLPCDDQPQSWREILEITGPAALIPCPANCKGPRAKGWQDITQGKLDDPEFQKELEKSNIAVNLGAPSDGLCSIDIDVDDAVEPFLNLNPRLRESLRTKRRRGCNIWVRVKGDYPRRVVPIETHDGQQWGEWRADGGATMIFGSVRMEGEAEPIPHQFLLANKPVEIEFAEIRWPDNVNAPTITTDGQSRDNELRKEYGDPFHLDAKGERIIGFNPRYFAAVFRQRHQILREFETGDFYQYQPENGVWRRESREAIQEGASKILQEFGRASNLPGFERKIVRDAREVVNILAGLAERRGAFTERPRGIHLKNGMVEFEKDGPVLRPFSPDYYSRNQSPIAWNDTAECPRFLNELLGSAIPEDDISLLQRFFGVCLFGYNDPQRLLLLIGQAGGGKGCLTRILHAIIGTENCYQLRTTHLEDRFEIGRCYGHTLLNGPDVKGNFLELPGAATLKALVGGDPLTGEAKGSNGKLRMLGTFNVLLTSNSRLRVRLDGDVEAWRRRMMIINFTQPPVEKRIPDFDKILVEEEGEGIVRWAVEGYIAAQREFEEFGDYLLTDEQKWRVDSLLNESQSLENFVRDCLQPAAGKDVTNEEIQRAYARYCSEQSWNPIKQDRVAKILPDLMLREFNATSSHDIKRDGLSKRGYRNFRLAES